MRAKPPTRVINTSPLFIILCEAAELGELLVADGADAVPEPVLDPVTLATELVDVAEDC